jgi:hypothetical protein
MKMELKGDWDGIFCGVGMVGSLFFRLAWNVIFRELVKRGAGGGKERSVVGIDFWIKVAHGQA